MIFEMGITLFVIGIISFVVCIIAINSSSSESMATSFTYGLIGSITSFFSGVVLMGIGVWL